MQIWRRPTHRALDASQQDEGSLPLLERPDALAASQAGAKGHQLVNKEFQYWALGLWLLIQPLVLFGLHRPISCVEHSREEAVAPTRCYGLVGDVSMLELPDFCWRPCFPVLEDMLKASVALAIFVQAAVVIFNHEGCVSCLRFRWYFDPADILKEEQKPGTPQPKQSGSYFKFLHPIKAVREMGMKRLTRHNTVQLVPGKALSNLSAFCVSACLMLLAFFIGVTYSDFPVFFECNGAVGEVIRVEGRTSQRRYQFGALVVAGVLMLIDRWLVAQAAWTFQLRFRALPSVELREQFHQADNGAIVKYFPRREPAMQYARLREAFMMELCKVGGDDGLRGPSDQDAWESDFLTLHFKKPKTPLSPERLHRKFAAYVLFLAACLLNFASHACWVCVEGIRATPGSAAAQLERQLLLFGACGRHDNVGSACGTASYALFVAVLLQIIIYLCTKKQERQYGRMPQPGQSSTSLDSNVEDYTAEELAEQEQLYVNILDMRKSVEMNPQRYREAGAQMDPVECHVWVRRGPSGEEEECDCCNGPVSREDRMQWERSTLPRPGVTITEAPPEAATLRSWRSGLLRSEFNLPLVCVSFEVEDKVTKAKRTHVQVVPPEFVAGHFHGWLALGPRVAWEIFAAALAIGAVLLVACDLTIFLLEERGAVLSNCSEVFNIDCLYFSVKNPARVVDMDAHHHVQFHFKSHMGRGMPIQFRLSIGLWIALAGSAVALFGVVGLRVAYEARNMSPGSLDCCSCRGCRPRCCSRSTCPAYMYAWCCGSRKLCAFLCDLYCGLCEFAVASCWRKLCPRRRRQSAPAAPEGPEA